MRFGEHLREIRKQKNISQEQLAELLNVSRQSVSKWEQDICYPEVEKLLLLSKVLGVSLDYLVGNGEYADMPRKENVAMSGRIMIKAYDGKKIVSCYKVISRRIGIGTGVPRYVLFGIDRASFLFFDENRTILGYYADKESIEKEMDAIMAAMNHGLPAYELQFCTKVKETPVSIQLAE